MTKSLLKRFKSALLNALAILFFSTETVIAVGASVFAFIYLMQ